MICYSQGAIVRTIYIGLRCFFRQSTYAYTTLFRKGTYGGALAYGAPGKGCFIAVPVWLHLLVGRVQTSSGLLTCMTKASAT